MNILNELKALQESHFLYIILKAATTYLASTVNAVRIDQLSFAFVLQGKSPNVFNYMDIYMSL